MKRMRYKPLLLIFGLSLVAVISSCGGGGGGGGGSSLPPPPPTRLVITTNFLPNGVEGRPYMQTLQASGGTPPYTWGLEAPCTLPPGASLSTAGVISIPSPRGGDIVVLCVKVTDSGGQTTGNSYSWSIAVLLQIPFTSLGPSNVGLNAMRFLNPAGGNPNFTWTLVSGSFPAGITLDPGGLLVGVPTQPGTATFTLKVADSSTPPQTAQGTVTWQITNFLVITNNFGLASGVVSRSYSQSLQAAGGTLPYLWSATSLPPGLNLDASSGKISGTPTAAASFTFSVQVTDSSASVQSLSVLAGIFISPVLSIDGRPLADGSQGNAYSGSFGIIGGVPPYSVAVTAGPLPAGIQLNPTSNLFGGANFHGVPTTLGTTQFTVATSDSEIPPMNATQNFSIRINPALMLPQPTNIPVGLQGQFYSFQYVAMGGLPPLSFSINSATPLPPGLSLNPSTGLVSGTPTAAFDGLFYIDVADSSAPPQSGVIAGFAHIAAILKLGTSALPPVALNTPLNIQFEAAGGTGPFTWSMASGSLPSGLSLDPVTGTISGTPTTPGTSTITLQINDPGPPVQTASASIKFNVMNSLGRNDTIVTATPLSNGTYHASISPASDPSSSGPDVDVYQLTAAPGAVVSVETFAQRLSPPSPLDTIIDIVDATGAQLHTCSDFSSPGTQFTLLCENNDQIRILTTDSKLFFQAPPGASGPVTIYVRVYDFKGRARPDFLYTLSISGAI